MRNTGEKRIQGFITSFCTIAFAVFSFTFVAMYKSPVFEVVYDSVATGKLLFNAYVVAGVMTTVLVGLALWLNRFAKFQREWTAMAFLPSALLLAFITDIDRTFFVGGKSYTLWMWILATGVVVYLFFSFVLKRILFEKIKNPTVVGNKILWRNLILLAFFFFSVGCLSSGESSFRYEAVQYVNYMRGNVDAALAVGKSSPFSSRQLTAQRAFLLASVNRLGESFFEYPVAYGAEGLLPSVMRDAPIAPDSAYSLIGVPRGAEEKAVDYLSRAVASDTAGNAARDYYLCSLLAERRIVDFSDAIYEYYRVGDVLPKHYREALVLYSYVTPEYSLPFDAAESLKEIDDFITRLKRPDCGTRCLAALFDDYGDTYWWYFLYGG